MNEMNDRGIPRRQFLKTSGAAVTGGLASSLPASPQVQAPSRPADLVLRNGKIITVDRDFTIAQAVAVAGDKIIAVGSDSAVAAHIASTTRVIDLNRRAVMPGLIDGHAHMDREGLKGVYPALGRVRSIADIQS